MQQLEQAKYQVLLSIDLSNLSNLQHITQKPASVGKSWTRSEHRQLYAKRIAWWQLQLRHREDISSWRTVSVLHFVYGSAQLNQAGLETFRTTTHEEP
jgi:hypothetical protein